MTDNPEDVVSRYFERPPVVVEPVARPRQPGAAPEEQWVREADALLGAPIVDAEAIAFVRRMLGIGQRVLATSFANSLMRSAETPAIGRYCAAIIAMSMEYYDYAWELFDLGDRDDAIRHLPTEYLGLWLSRDGAAAEARIRSLAQQPDALSIVQIWALARRAGAVKKYDLLAYLVGRIVEIDPALDGFSEAERINFEWTRRYLDAHPARDQIATSPSPATPEDEGRVNIGVIDYKMLDREKTTTNIGDYVQTLAFLSNLARFQSIEYDGGALGQKLESFKARVAPDRRVKKLTGKARAVAVNRDFSNWDDIPPQTWTFAFGWYMHPNFDANFDFPFHPNVRPIFISFHINNRSMLSEPAIEYLKTYQPIGCRDWTTVYILREKGVEAFFSGCVTTTIGQIFSEPAADVASDTVALVDYNVEDDEFAGLKAVPFTQAVDEVRDLKMVDALDSAIGLLNGYRRYSKIATSRLHCYLPCTSLGLEVTFKPKRRSDIRFEGLMNLSGKRFDKVRTGIEDKLLTMLRAVLSGDSEENIYAKWRRVCADDLAFAESYCTTYPPLPEPSFDIAATVDRMRAASYALNAVPAASTNPVNVAFALDNNLTGMLPPAIESAVANLSRPAVFYIMARGIERAYFEELARDYPNAHFKVFNFDGVDYGGNLNLLVHTTASTIDRLLLPDLLDDIDKIIYLDIDLIVLGDLAKLYDVALGDKPLAGKSSIPLGWRTGHDLLRRATSRMKPVVAWTLRRRLFAEGSMDFRCFNAGVTLMNLKQMRADDSSRKTVPLVENFRMNDQDALNMYARDNRIEFDGIWNTIPGQQLTGNDGILHYAGTMKQWGPAYVVRSEIYAANLARYEARRNARLAAQAVAE